VRRRSSQTKLGRFFNAGADEAPWRSGGCEGMMLQLQEFLDFNHYLTPSIIRIFYILQLALIALFTLSNLFTALAFMWHSLFLGLVWLAATLIGAVVAVIASRIFTEIIMVLFQNNEHLAAIRARAEGHCRFKRPKFRPQ
jgi:hypothetical protein